MSHLSNKLAIYAIVAVAVIIPILSGGVYSLFRAPLQQSIQDREITRVRAAMKRIDQALYHAYEGIQLIAGHNLVEELAIKSHQQQTITSHDRKKLDHEVFQKLGILTGPWNGIAIFDLDNHKIASTTPDLEILSQPEIQIATHHVQQGQIYSSGLIFTTNHLPSSSVLFAAPIYGEREAVTHIVGAVVGVFAWASISQILTSTEAQHPLYLFDETGLVISASRKYSQQIFQKLLSKSDIVQNALGNNAFGSDISESVTLENTKVLSAYAMQEGHLAYKGSGWGILLELPFKQAMAPVNQSMRFVIGIMVLFGITIVLGFYAMGRHLIKPIGLLTQGIQKVTDGNFEHRVTVHTNDEIEHLAQSFNQMLDRLQETTASKEGAEAANLAKTQFLSNMSHEIRTPLNAIVGFSQVLIERGRHLRFPEDLQQCMNNIKIAGQYLSEIINNILDIAKIESGKMEVQEEVVNLTLLVQGIFHINKNAAREKSLQFEYHVDSELPQLICSDRSKLNQILMNLVGNAIKFTPDGKSVSLRVQGGKNQLSVQVIDEGIGIPQDQVDKIFNPFEQADSQREKHFKGTGLGLSIVQKHVTLLNGQVSVASTLGKGSTFTVLLPLKKVMEPSEPLSQAPNTRYHFKQDLVILSIEDDPANQQMLQMLFENHGLILHMAYDGPEGVQRAKQLKPDLILMDLYMPEMDGIACAEAIRKIPDCADIPIIVISAEAFFPQEHEARQAGIYDYLTKPLDHQKLFKILTHYLQVTENSSEKVARKPPLPFELQNEINHIFELIRNLPPHKTKEILEHSKQIQSICYQYETSCFTAAQQIEDALLTGKSKRIPDILRSL